MYWFNYDQNAGETYPPKSLSFIFSFPSTSLLARLLWFALIRYTQHEILTCISFPFLLRPCLSTFTHFCMKTNIWLCHWTESGPRLCSKRHLNNCLFFKNKCTCLVCPNELLFERCTDSKKILPYFLFNDYFSAKHYVSVLDIMFFLKHLQTEIELPTANSLRQDDLDFSERD